MVCPKCKSKNTVEIIYGYPKTTTLIRSQKGEVKLGGCCLIPEGPNHIVPKMFCKDCGHKFGEWLEEDREDDEYEEE